MDIKLEADMSIEPGHQVIVLPVDAEGLALGKLLTGAEHMYAYMRPGPLGLYLEIAHTADVDARIVELIDALAHVRFSAPGLVQMTMEESEQPSAVSHQPSAVGGRREKTG